MNAFSHAPVAETEVRPPAEVLADTFLTLQTDAARINDLVNDPSIYDHVKGAAQGRIDLSVLFRPEHRGNHIVLCGEFGGVIFDRKMPGLYEMHTVVLPEGRGPWMMEGSRQAFHRLFTQTDCIEILTKCPHGNLAAKAGAKAVGMAYAWTVPHHYPDDGKMVHVDVYSLRVEHWARLSPYNEAIGVWFHEHLKSEYARLGRELGPHSEDDLHNRITGAAVAMIAGGQMIKGLAIYDRWAGMSGHPVAQCVSHDPVVIDLHECRVLVANGTFEVLP